MMNLTWKFFSLSPCWRPAILAACLSVLVLAFILLGSLINGTHISVYVLALGLGLFLSNLPGVFCSVAREQAKSESQIRALQERIEQLEAQTVQRVV